jgi:hypothetical protein
MSWRFCTVEAQQGGWSRCAGPGCLGQTPAADQAGRVQVQASVRSNPPRVGKMEWLRASGVTPCEGREMRRPRLERPARIDVRMQSHDNLFAASSGEGHLA